VFLLIVQDLVLSLLKSDYLTITLELSLIGKALNLKFDVIGSSPLAPDFLRSKILTISVKRRSSCVKMLFIDVYFGMMLFFLFSLFLSIVILSLSLLLSPKSDDSQKLSAFECGFNPFDDSRTEFNVKFYIVAILFIIFDLELSFLFPFVASYVYID
jgi:NADH:ubiquinone oxidoreductase subunit 3 (subunit A)